MEPKVKPFLGKDINGEQQEVGNKYAVFYRDNKVIFCEVFRTLRTNVTNHEGKCYMGFPSYDTLEEANQELIRYNNCKNEKCGTIK